MTRRNYRNPPIQEALCEFRFAASQEWDLTLPGRLYDEVKTEYPGKPRNVFQAQVQLGGAGAPPNVAWNQNVSAVQLVDAGGRRLVTVGPDMLSVHVLHPYPPTGWEEFKPRIERAFKSYTTVAAPTGVHRIGLRYINRVEVPEKAARIEKYFRCLPPAVPGLPEDLQAFLHRAEYAYEDGVKLSTTFATAESASGKASYVLDLDVVWEGVEPKSLADAIGLVEDLRGRERDAFEAVITDDLRSVFDAQA